jgi:hypothetical protein
MTVVERTEGGYTKVETKNGVIQHRDPNGHPVKQQSFAASKQQEQYDTEVTDRDPETGQIKDSETTETEDEEPPPPQFPAKRITASFQADTDDTTGQRRGDSVEVDAEIGGMFERRYAPTDDQIKDKMEQIQTAIATQMPFVDDADINIERTNVTAHDQPRGWSSFTGRDSIDVEFESGYEKSYQVDPGQSKIPEW